MRKQMIYIILCVILTGCTGSQNAVHNSRESDRLGQARWTNSQGMHSLELVKHQYNFVDGEFFLVLTDSTLSRNEFKQKRLGLVFIEIPGFTYHGFHAQLEPEYVRTEFNFSFNCQSKQSVKELRIRWINIAGTDTVLTYHFKVPGLVESVRQLDCK